LKGGPARMDSDASADYTTIHCSVADRILTVTLNRPDHLNAFTPTMARELQHVFERASTDDEVGAVVVTGAGRAFCAGMDLAAPGNVFGLDESLRPTLRDLTERLDDPAIADGVRDTGGKVTLSIFNCTKPVIAAINGPAVGIGATMTLAMDVRLAADTAKIGFVFGRLGIVCEACSSWFLPRIVGISQALEWLYSADIIDADEAKSGGLVRSVHRPEDLLAASYSLARRFIDHRSPVATALMRQMIYRNSAQPHPVAAHRLESLAMFYTSIGDGKEGVQAFRDKRPPRFTSRVSADMPTFYPWDPR
jgi:enoyl-CoA hydratase/carnithine racemase